MYIWMEKKKQQPNKKKHHQGFNELQWKVQIFNRCELEQVLCAGQEPVGCALMFNFLGFHFNKANCFQEKKRLISSSTEFKCMCQRLQQGWDIPQHLATRSSRTVSTSDIWLVLNKDPSVWISEAWNPAQWLEIGCRGTAHKKTPTVATHKTKPGPLSEESEDSHGSSTQGSCGGKNGLVVTHRMKDHESWSLISTHQHISHNTVGNTSFHKSGKNN